LALGLQIPTPSLVDAFVIRNDEQQIVRLGQGCRCPLAHHFATNTAFSDRDIQVISEILLRFEYDACSRIPRTYIILHLTGRNHDINHFLAAGITDIGFPLAHGTLPEAIKSPIAQNDFLTAQISVLTKALGLEIEDGRHRHLASAEDAPFLKIAGLGKGAYGYVDRVRSNISFKECARKPIPRGRTFRKEKAVLRDFEKGLGTLRKLSNTHIVHLVGSYTDPM
jgi:hypothetical protein